ELAGRGELLRLLSQVLLLPRGRLERNLLATELAVHERLVLAVPTVAGQPAGIDDGLEAALTQGHDLAPGLVAADGADIFALEREVGGQRGVFGVGPDFLVLLVLVLLGVHRARQAGEEQEYDCEQGRCADPANARHGCSPCGGTQTHRRWP